MDSTFLVRAHSRRQKRNGEAFIKLQLGDLTGSVEAVVWDDVDELAPLCPGGAVVRVLGRYTVDERYGATLTVKRLRAAAEGEYDLADLTEGPPIPYEQMAADLRELVGDDPAPAPARAARAPDRPVTRDRPHLPRGARRRSTTTRPTATACSSTACRSPRA